MLTDSKTLNISEIFFSIQGEGTRAGLLCVFIRLQGCELRCSWCDTPYALELKEISQIMTIEQIIDKVKSFGADFITVTGGEPLMQAGVFELMSRLCDSEFTVALETNGHQDISSVDGRVVVIMDVKCPDSAMAKNNNLQNLKYLKAMDEVKFVISSKQDYLWAKDFIHIYKLDELTKNIIFSPVFGKIDSKELAELILNDRLKVRLQLQLHKYIWDPGLRGV